MTTTNPYLITLSSMIVISLFFISCKKHIDDTSKNIICTDSCTTLKGRFIIGNDQGIENIEVEIKSEIRPTLGIGKTTIRKITTGRTDFNGNYSLRFKLNKDEFGQNAHAAVYLNFKYDQSKFLPISWYNLFGAKELVGPFLRRDTTVSANIYLTSKGAIKVKLIGFKPILPGDDFSVSALCKAGLDRRESSDSERINANQETTEAVISACGNEMTKLYIRRKKNGIISINDTTVTTPVGSVPAVQFKY